MSLSKLIVFPQHLSSVRAKIRSRMCSISEAEIEEIREAARNEGAERARQLADRQLVDFRADVQQVQQGLFYALEKASNELSAQVKAALPQLAVAISRRLLHGWTPPPELVEKICRESLAELFPETAGLELVVAKSDAIVLEKSNPAWLRDFPGLKISVDNTFNPGDCIVRSRFGVVDARLSTRLAALEESLTRA